MAYRGHDRAVSVGYAQIALPIEDPAETRLSGEIDRTRRMALAVSEAVLAETLEVFRSRNGEFLWASGDLMAVKKKYDLGFYFNRTLDELCRRGQLEDRKVFFGAESPVGNCDLVGRRKPKRGAPAPVPYLGYRIEHRFREECNG